MLSRPYPLVLQLIRLFPLRNTTDSIEAYLA